jgi:aminopeptidase-like protein
MERVWKAMRVYFRDVKKIRVNTGSHSQRSACIDFYAEYIDSTKFKSAFLFENYFCHPPLSYISPQIKHRLIYSLAINAIMFHAKKYLLSGRLTNRYPRAK